MLDRAVACESASMKLVPFAPIHWSNRLIAVATTWWLAATFIVTALNCTAAAGTGSFTLVGSMKQFRRQHTATLLSDGRVLVAGGAPVLVAATSEIYDPSTTTWTHSGALNTGRQLHTATLLQDGRVMVTGGQTDSQLLSSTEVYDPASGSWTNVGRLNEARELHTATPLTSALVLVTGGFPNISSAEGFDPTSGEWSPTGSMNTPRYQHTATLLPDGSVLVTGGLNATDVLASAEVYDPKTRLWTLTGSMHVPRATHTASLLPNGKVLVTGGDEAGAPSELYDPATGLWTLTGAPIIPGNGGMNIPRQTATTTLLADGKVLAAGGFGDGTIQATAELYDPTNSGWTITGAMHAIRWQAAAVSFGGYLFMLLKEGFGR